MRRVLPIVLAVLALGTSAAVAAYTNVKVNTNSNSPEETSIAINPTNPLNQVGAAQTPCRYYTTTDGGATWFEGTLPDPFDLGDSQMCFDADGNVYYCYIGQFSHSGIFMNKSSDGGFTWMPAGTPVVDHSGSIPFEDKATAVCDWTNGAHRGNVYVGWTRFDVYGSSNSADSSYILFSRSTNGGASYSAPVRVGDRGGNAIDSDLTVEGAVPAVGPDGTVYMAWSGPRGIEFDSSSDGGVTWGTDRVISDQPGGWDFPISGLQRCNGLPITKADFSGGVHNGRVYVCWSDQRNGDTDVFLLYSDDGGVTWSPRIRINDDAVSNGREQFMPAFDIDPLTGALYCVFYDRRNHTDKATDVYLAYSTDGGDTWTNELISGAPFTPKGFVFLGDYIGLSVYGPTVRPLWARNDNSGVLSVWTALVDQITAIADARPPRADARVGQRLVIGHNPTNGPTRIAYESGVSFVSALTILDAAGRIVREYAPAHATREFVWDTRDALGRDVPAGVYFARAAGAPAARVVVMR